MRLARIPEFRALFSEASRPSRVTVLSWIDSGLIQARKIGRCWYIDLDAFRDSTGNPLADRILKAAA